MTKEVTDRVHQRADRGEGRMTKLSEQQQDDLFEAFADAQSLERRIMKIISRGSISAPAIAELQGQIKSIAERINGLVKAA